MKIVLAFAFALSHLGLIVGLFGQAPATSAGEAGGVLGGAAGVGSLALVIWLIKDHRGEMKEIREAQSKELAIARDQYTKRETARDAAFNDTIREIVKEFKQTLREYRDENQQNIERQFENNKEVVAALEHVNSSLITQSRHLEEFGVRLKALEGGDVRPPGPPSISPPPGPHPARRRGDRPST